MAIALIEQADERVVDVVVTGKLRKEDYEHFVPAIERLINRHGKIRILFKMIDFHGWTAGALWEDVKFDARHFRDIERLAVVGEKTWEKGMAVFCKPFTTADVRYFDVGEIGSARDWIEEGLAPSPAAVPRTPTNAAVAE